MRLKFNFMNVAIVVASALLAVGILLQIISMTREAKVDVLSPVAELPVVSQPSAVAQPTTVPTVTVVWDWQRPGNNYIIWQGSQPFRSDMFGLPWFIEITDINGRVYRSAGDHLPGILKKGIDEMRSKNDFRPDKVGFVIEPEISFQPAENDTFGCVFVNPCDDRLPSCQVPVCPKLRFDPRRDIPSQVHLVIDRKYEFYWNR